MKINKKYITFKKFKKYFKIYSWKYIKTYYFLKIKKNTLKFTLNLIFYVLKGAWELFKFHKLFENKIRGIMLRKLIPQEQRRFVSNA